MHALDDFFARHWRSRAIGTESPFFDTFWGSTGGGAKTSNGHISPNSDCNNVSTLPQFGTAGCRRQGVEKRKKRRQNVLRVHSRGSTVVPLDS